MINCVFEDGGQAKLRHVTCGVILHSPENEEILLVKRSTNSFTCPDKWALLGGFVDHGEFLAEAALRELREETGIEGQIEALFRIVDNPNRPQEDRANIDFIFTATVKSKIGQPDHEISEIRWFKYDDIPAKEEWAFDHWENVQLFRKHLTEPLALPLVGKIG